MPAGVHSAHLTGFLVLAVPGILFVTPYAAAQTSAFPWRENFDSSCVPALPAGWASSRNRAGTTDDMTTSQSAPRSAPNCVTATNATVAQWLSTPELDFSRAIPGSLRWFMRRSSTFIAPLVVEYSTDGGGAWSLIPGDTIRPDGSLAYGELEREMPRFIAGTPRLRIRWRVVPAAAGSTGTLRIDDVSLTAHAAYDLALVRLEALPFRPDAPEPVTVTGTVKNVGMIPASGFSLALYRNCGDTLRPAPCGCIARSGQSGVLNPGDSCALTLSAVTLDGGANSLLGVVADTADMDTSDNCRTLEVDVASAPGDIVIDEIMYAPFAGEGEYVELMNTGSRGVNLGRWELVARSGTSSKPKTLVLPPLGFSLPPGGYAVVAEDSGLFRFFPWLAGSAPGRVIIPPTWETRLDNSGEDLLLKDPWGSLADSVPYSPAWHNPAVVDRTGRSLERITAAGRSSDPSNWSTCTLAEGGTPGKANSVAITRSSPAGSVSAHPNPFSPDADGRDDATLISYRIPQGVWSVSVRIFDARGRLIRTLAVCEPSTGNGELVWDGRDGERLTARMGIYVIYVEATDAARLASFTATGVVVLARRLN